MSDPQRADPLIREILADPEFARLEPGAEGEAELIAELVSALFDTVQTWLAGLGVEHPGVFLFVLLAALAILAGLAWWGARGAARRRAGANIRAENLPELLRGDPKILRTQAYQAANQRDWLLAARYLFRAQIIEQALQEGILARLADAESFRRARTYRELVMEFSRENGEERLALASRIEAALYGHQSLTEADWHQLLTLERR